MKEQRVRASSRCKQTWRQQGRRKKHELPRRVSKTRLEPVRLEKNQKHFSEKIGARNFREKSGFFQPTEWYIRSEGAAESATVLSSLLGAQPPLDSPLGSKIDSKKLKQRLYCKESFLIKSFTE